jgi:hypothetical protein
MKLLGREQEITLLNKFVDDSTTGSILLCGLPGSGKSYLLRKWYHSLNLSNELDCAMVRVSNGLSPAQTTLKRLCELLFYKRTEKEQQDLIAQSQRFLPENTSLLQWFQTSNDSFRTDGLRVLEFLKLCRQSHEQKIVLIVDQAERLSKEARFALKCVAEWKPDGVLMILSIATLNAEEKSRLSEFGMDFSLKGGRELQVAPLSDAFLPEYFDIYGIGQLPEGWHFMDCALLQKRMWLLEQIESIPQLAGIFVHLACRPYGLNHAQTAEVLTTLTQENPLFQEILVSEPWGWTFENEAYAHDVLGRYSQVIKDIPKEEEHSCINVLHRFHEAQIHGLQDNDINAAMFSLYAATGDLDNLYQLLEAISTSGAADLEMAVNIFDNCSDKNRLPSREELLAHVAIEGIDSSEESLKRIARLLPSISQSMQKRFLWKLLKMGPDTLKQCMNFLNNNSEPYGYSSWLYDFFQNGNASPQRKQGQCPVLDTLIQSATFETSGELTLALQCLQNAAWSALQSGAIHALSPIYTRMSDLHDNEGDHDARIDAYRNAVIAEQFIVEGATA